MDEELDDEEKQSDKQIANTKPWLWKKGQSGNIMGRPKGKTMKEYVKEYLSRMTDEERDEWLEGIDKHKIWEMAEDKAKSNTDVTSDGEALKVLGINYIQPNGNKPEANS